MIKGEIKIHEEYSTYYGGSTYHSKSNSSQEQDDAEVKKAIKKDTEEFLKKFPNTKPGCWVKYKFSSQGNEFIGEVIRFYDPLLDKEYPTKFKGQYAVLKLLSKPTAGNSYQTSVTISDVVEVMDHDPR